MNENRPQAAGHRRQVTGGRFAAGIPLHPTPYTLHPSSKRGFTLVEILVAIAILGIVLSTIYVSYLSTMRVVKSLEYGDEVYSMARVALERMVADLQSACKEKDDYEFVTLRDSTGRLPVKGVSFLSRAHLDFSGPGSTMAVAQIRYELEGDIESGGFSIVRRDVLRQGGGESAAEGFILCRRLQSVNLRFYDSSGREYPAWDSMGGTESQRSRVPSAILIELSFINPDDAATPYKFMTRLLLAGEVKT